MCIREVLNNGLLRTYGLLILDNAERDWYHEAADSVPDSWLAVSFANRRDETALWMSCPRDDALCRRAQHDIDAALSLVPGSQGGTWKRRFVKRLSPVVVQELP